MNPEMFKLDRSSPEAEVALETGLLYSAGTALEVRPFDLVTSPMGEVILFKSLDDLLKPSRFKQWIVATRAYSLTATLTPCVAILIQGLNHQLKANWLFAGTCFFAIIFLQIAVNVLNDVEDFKKLIDLPGMPGGSGVISKGWYTAKSLRRVGYYSLMISAFLALPALISQPALATMAGILGGLGALTYSHPKFGLKYNGLGDLAVFLLCGPFVTVGYSMAVFGEIDGAVWTISIFLGALSCAILHANNIQDIELDHSRGARTVAVRLGFLKARHLFVIYYLAGFGALIFGWLGHKISGFSLLALVAVIAALKLIQKVYQASGPLSPLLHQTRVQSAQVHLIAGALFCLGSFFGMFF